MKNYKQGFAIPLIIAIIALLGIGGGSYVYVNKKSAEKTENSIKEITKNNASNKAVSDPTEQIKIESRKIEESLKTNPTDKTPVVRIISPNGGENLVVGGKNMVKWWDDSDAGNKNIYVINSVSTKTLIPVSESNFMRSSGIDGTYSYAWEIGENIVPGSYKIMVCKANTNDCDTSDNIFSIVSVGTQNPTSDWKTYKNDKYGFSFQYPEVIIFSSPTSTTRNVFIIDSWTNQIPNKDKVSIGLYVSNIIGSGEQTIKNNRDLFSKQANIQEIKLGVSPAIKISEIQKVVSDTSGKESYTSSVILESFNNKNYYSFQCSQEGSNLDKCNQIISTFKFN